MKPWTLSLLLFACFSLGLPIWLMGANKFDSADTNRCSGDCYEAWVEETGGVVSLALAAADARASASPAELGQQLYGGCIACHGAGGEGGIGPKLSGQPPGDIVDKLMRYKAGETIGGQSNLMWGQAAMLSEDDMENLAAYISTL